MAHRTLRPDQPNPSGSYVYRIDDKTRSGWLPRYVGQGKNGRAREHGAKAMAGRRGHNAALTAHLRDRIINGRPWRIVIIAEGLTTGAALLIEERHIRKHGRMKDGGTLFNHRPGSRTWDEAAYGRWRAGRPDAAAKAVATRERRLQDLAARYRDGGPGVRAAITRSLPPTTACRVRRLALAA
jgi:hypothetical protein